ncbi:hypothetical protein [Natronospora cellulosivora (SeqCode)]
MSLYFGKFSRKYPQQINEMFYAGGERGSVYYGGIEAGDYVFPIFEGQVIGLWKVTKYGQKKNKINKENSEVVFFEEVKKFDEPIRYQNKFARYRYFELDLNTLNKSIKSHKSGFVPIKTSSKCPEPKDIVIEGNLRNFYIMLEDQEDVFFEEEQKSFQEEDVRILINNLNETKILSMQIYKNGTFITYDLLNNLYKVRNPEEERYTIKELFKYAKLDNAPRKEKYLKILLDDLEEKGYYIEYNPIFL